MIPASINNSILRKIASIRNRKFYTVKMGRPIDWDKKRHAWDTEQWGIRTKFKITKTKKNKHRTFGPWEEGKAHRTTKMLLLEKDQGSTELGLFKVHEQDGRQRERRGRSLVTEIGERGRRPATRKGLGFGFEIFRKLGV